MTKKFLLKYVPEEGQPVDPEIIFSHYWRNDGDNFPDVEDIEDYLQEYYFSKGYKWVEIPDVRKENNSIQYMKLELRSRELPENRFLYMKVEDGHEETNADGSSSWVLDEIPMYYYATNYKYVSDENYPEQTYEAQLELDMWATFGCKMHAIMKETNEPILFENKMCDRFLRDKSGTGYWIDYLQQPWIANITEQNLTLYRYENEPTLSYTDWLYANSGLIDVMNKEAWINDIWLPWIENQITSHFNLEGKSSSSIPSTLSYVQTKVIQDYYQALRGVELSDDLQIFEEDYNANGKYKWLITRTGNNTVVTDDTESKHAMFPKWKDAFIDIQREVYGDTYEYTDSKSGVKTTEWQDKFIELSTNELDFQETYKGTYTVKFTCTIPVKVQNSIDDTQQLTFQPLTKLLSTPIIQLNINNKVVYISNQLDCQLSPIDYENPFDTGKILIKFNKEKTYIPALKDVIEFTPTLWFTVNTNGLKTQSVTFTLALIFEDKTDKLELSIPKKLYFEERKTSIGTESKEFYSFELLDKEDCTADPQTEKFYFNGEQLLMIPLRKGLVGQQWIKYLNNTSDKIILGDDLTLGMVINDIPPTVLAAALRTYSTNASFQAYGDLISLRETAKMENPLDFITISTTSWAIPTIVNTLDYIPVTIAMSPSYNKFDYIIGGAAFLNKFYRLLTDYESINTENIMENEPALCNPNLWKWIYLIDGKNRIDVTADMIDTKKMITTDWVVNMNVNITDTTHYRLDIDDIKNDAYMYTKSFMELTSVDTTSHPYSTEQYNNWLQENQLTQETSKNAEVTIPNEYARKNWAWSIAGNLLGGTGTGAATGAKVGGPYGAVIGAVAGTALGGLSVGTSFAGLQNKIEMSEKIWQNKWDGFLANKYSAPATLNPGGFEKGSLLWSDIDPAKTDDYSLMRTFKPNDIVLSKLWDDISTNGYPFMGECIYNDYDNRKNFNIVNCNPSNKSFFFKQLLYRKMRDSTTLFSNENSISWFLMKCTEGIRLFHQDYRFEDMEKLIKGNVEKLPYIPYQASNSYVVYDNINVFPFHNTHELHDGELNDYVLQSDKKTYLRTSNNIPYKEFKIYYNELDPNVENLEEFKKEFCYLAGDHYGSNVKQIVYNETLKKDAIISDVQTEEYFNIIDDFDFTMMNEGDTQSGEFLVSEMNNWSVMNVYAQDWYIHPYQHKVGYKLSITAYDTYLDCRIDELDAWIFDQEVSGPLTWTSRNLTDTDYPTEAFKLLHQEDSIKQMQEQNRPAMRREAGFLATETIWDTCLSNTNWITSVYFKGQDKRKYMAWDDKNEIRDLNLVKTFDFNKSQTIWIQTESFDSQWLKVLKPYIDYIDYEFVSNYDVNVTSEQPIPTGPGSGEFKEGIVRTFDNLFPKNNLLIFSCKIDVKDDGTLATRDEKFDVSDKGYKEMGSWFHPGINGLYDGGERMVKQFFPNWKLENSRLWFGLSYIYKNMMRYTNMFLFDGYYTIYSEPFFNIDNLRIDYNNSNLANQKSILHIHWKNELDNLREEYINNFLKLYFLRTSEEWKKERHHLILEGGSTYLETTIEDSGIDPLQWTAYYDGIVLDRSLIKFDGEKPSNVSINNGHIQWSKFSSTGTYTFNLQVSYANKKTKKAITIVVQPPKQHSIGEYITNFRYYYPWCDIFGTVKTDNPQAPTNLWNDVEISNITETSFTISAKSTSTLYIGSINVTGKQLYDGYIIDGTTNHYFYGNVDFLKFSGNQQESMSTYVVCPDGTSLSTVYDFNYKIVFNNTTSFTEIPTYFLTQYDNFNQELILPQNITKINYNFMTNCHSFNQNITIPNSVTYLSGNGFLNNNGMQWKTITLSNNIQNTMSNNGFLDQYPSKTHYVYMGPKCTQFTLNIGTLTADKFEGTAAAKAHTGCKIQWYADEGEPEIFTNGITIIGDHKAELMTNWPNYSQTVLGNSDGRNLK